VHDLGLGAATAPCVIASMAKLCARRLLDDLAHRGNRHPPKPPHGSEGDLTACEAVPEVPHAEPEEEGGLVRVEVVPAHVPSDT
jgi:hypothetical protein